MSLDARHPRLQAVLRDRLFLQGHPLLVLPDQVLPAASLWTGMRAWVRGARQLGLGPGSRVVVQLPPSGGLLQVGLAALWEGWSLTLCDPRSTPDVDPEVWIARVAGAGRWCTPDTMSAGPPVRYASSVACRGEPVWTGGGERLPRTALVASVLHGASSPRDEVELPGDWNQLAAWTEVILPSIMSSKVLCAPVGTGPLAALLG